jgi:hypothetical protein
VQVISRFRKWMSAPLGMRFGAQQRTVPAGGHLDGGQSGGRALKTKFRTAKVGLFVLALSSASLVAAGFDGSDAGAAIRTTNSKLCKEYASDIKKTNYTPQQQVNSYRKIANVAPSGLKRELVTLAGELQAAINKGSFTTSQKKSIQRQFDKIESQFAADCKK